VALVRQKSVRLKQSVVQHPANNFDEFFIDRNCFHWNYPRPDFVKFDGDVFVTNSGSLASCGVLIRNVNRSFMVCLAVNLGACIITMATLSYL